MLTFVFRVGAHLYDNHRELDARVGSSGAKSLKRTVTLPFDFVPRELNLLFGKAGDTILAQRFEVESTEWREREQRLVVSSQGHWYAPTYERRWAELPEFGWEVTDHPELAPQ